MVSWADEVARVTAVEKAENEKDPQSQRARTARGLLAYWRICRSQILSMLEKIQVKKAAEVLVPAVALPQSHEPVMQFCSESRQSTVFKGALFDILVLREHGLLG